MIRIIYSKHYYMENYTQKYLKYKNKYLELKKMEKKNMSGGGPDKINVILFKADWCGHCKSFKSTWEGISKMPELNNKYNFTVYDADKDRSTFEEYKVDAFPTILVEKGKGNIIPYNGDRSFEDLNGFLNGI